MARTGLTRMACAHRSGARRGRARRSAGAADTRAAELLQVREARDSLSADLTKLAAQLEAQQQLLVNYRMRLGGADAAG